MDHTLFIGHERTERKTKEGFANLFTVTDIEHYNYFLGEKLDHNANGFSPSQTGYTEWIIESANMVDCKPSRTPLPLLHQLYEARTPITESE